MQLILFRYYEDLDTTVGKMIVSEKILNYNELEKITLREFNKLSNIFSCYTIELSWKNNAKNISCIPKGVYNLSLHNSKKFKNTLLLNEVPNRAGILIHVGNSAVLKETQGCILPATSLDIKKDAYGINSRIAFNEIMKHKTNLKSIIVLDNL